MQHARDAASARAGLSLGEDVLHLVAAEETSVAVVVMRDGDIFSRVCLFLPYVVGEGEGGRRMGRKRYGWVSIRDNFMLHNI